MALFFCLVIVIKSTKKIGAVYFYNIDTDSATQQHNFGIGKHTAGDVRFAFMCE